MDARNAVSTRSPRRSRLLKAGVVAIGVIAIATVVGLAVSPTFLRHGLEHYLSARLGRDVHIGDLALSPGRITQLRLTDLSIANAAWSEAPAMAHVRELDVYFPLSGLPSITPAYARLVTPEIRLERNAEGAANWDFDGGGAWADLPATDIVDGTLRYLHPSEKTDVHLTLSTHSVEGERSALRVKGKGSLHGAPLALEATGAGLPALQRTDDPYALEVHARSGKTEVHFDGTVVPGDPENLRGELRLRGPDMSALYPIVPTPFPWTPPYVLKGELAHASGRWSFRHFAGSVGDSDLAGDFEVDTSKPRSKTIADLTSARFDYQDLGGFVGLPQGAPQRAAARSAAAASAPDKLFSVREFDLAALRDHDADVKFRGKAVKLGKTPLDDIVSHLKLESGVMHFDPLDFGIAGGHAVTNITMDLHRGAPDVQGRVEVKAVELERLFPKLAPPSGTVGRIAGRAHFNATGASVAAMAASLDGEAALVLRGGEASKLQIVLTNLDLARAASLLLRGDETASLRCAVLAVHAQDGVVTPSTFVVDTSEVLIHGAGTADLRNEQLDVTLTAESKRPSLVALRGPVIIDGPMSHPSAHPALGQAVTRVGAAVGLGALAPPLALLPLIDLGGADDVDCRSVVAKARAETDTTKRLPREAARRKPKGKVQERTASTAE